MIIAVTERGNRMNDTVYRQDAIAKLKERRKIFCKNRLDFTILPDKDKARVDEIDVCIAALINLPSADPERLTDDDFETIRIQLNAYKESLCNQRRWKEAEEYQRIIDRFMRFASAQPEPLTDKEQRIFLAAMGREEKVCKEVDDEWRDCREPYEDSLVHVCKEIRRKVKCALWT